MTVFFLLNFNLIFLFFLFTIQLLIHVVVDDDDVVIVDVEYDVNEYLANKY